MYMPSTVSLSVSQLLDSIVSLFLGHLITFLSSTMTADPAAAAAEATSTLPSLTTSLEDLRWETRRDSKLSVGLRSVCPFGTGREGALLRRLRRLPQRRRGSVNRRRHHVPAS